MSVCVWNDIKEDTIRAVNIKMKTISKYKEMERLCKQITSV